VCGALPSTWDALRLTSSHPADAFCRDVDLSYNIQLRSIVFNILGVQTIYWTRELEGLHISPILSQITSPHIRQIIINVGLYIPEDLNVIDWASIERTLERPNYSHLQKLTISGVNDLMLEETKRWMQERLPGCHARGVIECRG
jgi:hypothetical protein